MITSSMAHAICAIVSAVRSGPATAGAPPRPPESSTVLSRSRKAFRTGARPNPQPVRIEMPPVKTSTRQLRCTSIRRGVSGGSTTFNTARACVATNTTGDAAERREEQALGQELPGNAPR